MSYENRFIAFLDILGFKNWIEKTVINESIFNTIKAGLDYISNEREELYHGHYSDMRINNKEISVFSDSIVISYSMDKGSLFYVLMDLIYICINLNSKGIFVRGGVSFGKLYHKNHECFGPAMVKAYELEQKQAIYPRIVVEPEVVKNGIMNPGPANTPKQELAYIEKLLSEDKGEGIFYLDYLSQYEEMDSIEEYMDLICKIKKHVANNLEQTKNHEHLFRKYIWFAKYYNKTVEKVFKNTIYYSQFIISSKYLN